MGLKRLFFVASLCGVVTALLFHLVLGIASYGLMYMSRHAPYVETPETCCHFPLPYKNISLQSPHGILPHTFVNISGWFFPHLTDIPQCGNHSHLCDIYNTSNNNATILAIHGHGSNMGKVEGRDKSVLHKAVLPFLMTGYNVMAIDLRNHGASGDALPVSLGKFEYLDVLAALDWLHDGIVNGDLPGLDPDRIGVYGESMGGATVLMAAGSDTKNYINAIACESSYTSAKEAFKSWIPAHAGGYVEFLGFDFAKSDAFLEYMWKIIIFLFPYEFKDIRPLDMIESIHCPMFITHGHTDVIIPFSHSGEIITAAKNRKLCGKKRNLACVTNSTFYGGGHVESFAHPNVVLDMINFMEEHV